MATRPDAQATPKSSDFGALIVVDMIDLVTRELQRMELELEEGAPPMALHLARWRIARLLYGEAQADRRHPDGAKLARAVGVSF